MYERTHSASALAMVAFCQTLPFFLMAPVTAYFADHFNKRSVFILADTIQVLCLVTLMFVDSLGFQEIWPVLAVVFLTKFLATLFETMASFQLVPAIVSKTDLPKANGWFLIAQRLVQVAGPLIGGLLLSLHGFDLCIALNVLSFGATLYFSASFSDMNRVVWGDRKTRQEEQDFVANFAQNIRYVLQSPLFRPFVILMFFWNLSSFLPNSPTITYYFSETHHFSAAQYGLVTALFAMLGMIGYLRTSAHGPEQFEKSLVQSSLLQAISATVALVFFGFPVPLAVCMGLSRSNGASLTLLTFLLRQTMVPREKSGSINACLRMLFMSASPLAALLQAILIPRLGVGTSLIYGVACLWITYWYSKKVAVAYTKYQSPEAQTQAA